MTGQDAEPGLAPHLSRILEQDYPRFSAVVLITDDGIERLHAAPRGFLGIGRA